MRLFGLIGHPLAHSFSKNYFAQKFSNEHLAHCRYENFPLQNIAAFPELIKLQPDLQGLNVTIPHKETVLPFLSELDEAAKIIGAVNTIKISSGKTIGFNTDYIGFLRALQPLLKAHHQRALILGTGGSSKAVQYALSLLNIQHTFVSRTKKDAALIYAELNKNILQETDVIINTTPLGMFPETASFPDIPYQYLNEKHVLFDLIYNPLETVFLQKGKMQGATTINGFSMLQIQAEESWKIWNRF